MIFNVSHWTTLPFFDSKGQLHKIFFDQGGLIALCLFKIAMNLLFMKWGQEALLTYKPIVSEVEREEIEGVSAEVRAESNSKRIQVHKKKVAKLVLASFAVFAVSMFAARKFFTKTALRLVDDEYDAYYARQNQTSQTNSSAFFNQTGDIDGEETWNNTNPISPLLPSNETKKHP
jgi:hypothetical protein